MMKSIAVALMIAGLSGCTTNDGSNAKRHGLSATQAAMVVLKPVATTQTAFMTTAGDAADDPALWIDRRDSSRSTILGTDKHGGLNVFTLDGDRLQAISTDAHPDNVDVLYDFPLNGTLVDLAIAGCRGATSLGVKVWTIDRTTRTLADVTEGGVLRAFGGTEPYGSCTYHSPRDGSFYYFVNNKRGVVEQYRLHANADDTVGAEKVRTMHLRSQVEGCVADDERGTLFVAEEDVGIWKFAAEPDASIAGEKIASVGEHGLAADVEGLTLYCLPKGAGYLIASSQGSNTFNVYRRDGNHAYVATIDPAASATVDDIEETDGIAATSERLGDAYPAGLLVVHDGRTPSGRQNFKLFDWRTVAGKLLSRSDAASSK